MLVCAGAHAALPPLPMSSGEAPPPGALRRFARRSEAAFRRLPLVAALKEVFRAPLRIADRRTRCRYYLAVGAIFKDEARFLEEWLTFHQGVGVEHFYLYDNLSSDDFRAVLAPWIERGTVTLVPWPHKPGQVSAYNDCLARCRAEARWLALIDIDEFLFSPRARDLRPLLRAYEGQPGIFVYWHMFGASGHEARPPGPVIESYRRREAKARRATGKSILNPRLIAEADIHVSKPKVGSLLDENGRPPTLRDAAATPSWEVFRINHYWSKSIEDLRAKVARGFAFTDRERQLEHQLERERRYNDVEDLTIQAVWEAIKARPGLPPPPTG